MEEKVCNLYLVGNVGGNNEIILQFWKPVEQTWAYFLARRTAPGEYMTNRGKSGKFIEKPLTIAEAKAAEVEAPKQENQAAKYPWRVCKQSEELAATLTELVEAGKLTKEAARAKLMEKYPLTPPKSKVKPDAFSALA